MSDSELASLALRSRQQSRPTSPQTTDVALPLNCYFTIYLSNKERAALGAAIKLRRDGIITAAGEPLEASTNLEINALIGRGVFEFITYDPRIHGNARIFKSRIVNEVKGQATNAPYEKSRLVIQGYADDGKEAILTQAPTIQRASQRLVLALALTLIAKGMVLWLRDITQAYVQSATQLNRISLCIFVQESFDNSAPFDDFDAGNPTLTIYQKWARTPGPQYRKHEHGNRPQLGYELLGRPQP